MNEPNFPPAFEERMQTYLGEQWKEFAHAHQQPSPISIRVNSKKRKDTELAAPVPWTSHGFYLKERPSFTLDPAFHAGSYYVQEASSMFLEQAFVQCCDPNKPLNVLDLCAAPGGKSTHLLSLMNKQSLLVSNEVIRSRASVLEENLQKWGHHNVVITSSDPKDFQRLPGFFDVLVVDAPCSGEGLFRKDPQAMKEWSTHNVAICSSRQRRILGDSWSCLKEGGLLIYSTCTYNEAENEENLKWLKTEYDVEFIPIRLDEKWGVETVNPAGTIGYHLYPHRVRGEGFFLSVMRKKTNDGETRLKNKQTLVSPPRKLIEQLYPWITQPEEKAFILRNDQIQFFPKERMGELELLAKNLYIIVAGTLIASTKHDKLIPEHPSALSVDLNIPHFNSIEVDLQEALKFLRKEALEPTFDQLGFALIRYKTLPLGWVNVLSNRMNNLYPSAWRIRMADKSNTDPG